MLASLEKLEREVKQKVVAARRACPQKWIGRESKHKWRKLRVVVSLACEVSQWSGNPTTVWGKFQYGSTKQQKLKTLFSQFTCHQSPANVRPKPSEYNTINARMIWNHQWNQTYPQMQLCETTEGTEQWLTTVLAVKEQQYNQKWNSSHRVLTTHWRWITSNRWRGWHV